jgi:acyl-CoA thioesterase
MYEFDHDTQISELGSHLYRATVSDRWGIAGVPNGGYVMALALGALTRSLPKPDPLTLTAHFFSPCRPGGLDIAVEVIKIGKRHANAMARLLQDDREVARVLASFGDLASAEGPTHVAAEPPAFPPPDDPSTRVEMMNAPEIAQRFDQRFDPSSVGWYTGNPSGKAEIRAWQRFADGRPTDVASLVLFADSLSPPIFEVVSPGWAPTIELTVHIRNRPAPGWLRSVFRTRFLYNGYLEEEGELWDDNDHLVAQSRQLATVPRSSRV